MRHPHKISSPASIGYVGGIDGLRALAVLSVFAFHLNKTWLPGGYAGVDIFFVISGFVVTASVLDRSFSSFLNLLTTFYARRILRIMPALAVMLMLTILAWAVFVPDSFLSSTSADVARSAFFGFSNVVLAFKSTDYFGTSSDYNPFLHTWSLGVEEQFYFIFPFLIFWHQRRVGAGRSGYLTTSAVLILVLISLGVSAFTSRANEGYAFYLIPSRFWELGIGMLLCLTAASWRGWLSASRTLTRAITVASTALVAGSLAIPESPGNFPFPIALTSVVGTAGLIAVLTADKQSLVSRCLTNPLFVLIGRASYSLYLWHWPVFVMMRWTVGLESLPQILCASAIALFLGFLSYFIVEQRILRNETIKALPRGRVAVAGLCAVVLSAAIGHAIIRAKNSLSQSVTASARSDWYPYGKPTDTQLNRCQIKATAKAFETIRVSSYQPVNCEITPRTGRLYTIGDSHAGAMEYILRQFAQSQGVEVQLLQKPGCPFLSLRPQGNIGECASFTPEVRRYLDQQIRPGDVIVLTSLRVKRISDQQSSYLDLVARVETPPPDSVQDAEAFIRFAEERGVNVVWSAPLPVFPSSPFRCADWFNRTNPDCRPGLAVSRADIDTRREGVLQTMNATARNYRNVSIWDPLPYLCSTTLCDAMPNGRPLFFDGNHLSGFGNVLLYPRFADHIVKVIGSAVR